jgi:hypothetical protein
MASDCLVLSSDNSSLREVNTLPEFCFNAFDNNDIIFKIQYIFSMNDEKKSRVIEKNREYARSLSWKNTAEKTIEVFNSL